MAPPDPGIFVAHHRNALAKLHGVLGPTRVSNGPLPAPLDWTTEAMVSPLGMPLTRAEAATAKTIEDTLSQQGTYRKIEDRLYVIKQGSTYVLINIVPWGEDKALVRCCAQLVRGVDMSAQLAVDLLKLNAKLRFGAFAYDPVDKLVLFLHSILGGQTLDRDELLATLTDVAILADEYDDKIIENFGGQTMRELLEEAAMERVLDADPREFRFGGEA